MTDTPGDAALRRVVRGLRTFASKHPDDMLTVWADEIERALEANTRHTPEGGAYYEALLEIVRWAQGGPTYEELRHAVRTRPALMPAMYIENGFIRVKEAAPQSGAPDAEIEMVDGEGFAHIRAKLRLPEPPWPEPAPMTPPERAQLSAMLVQEQLECAKWKTRASRPAKRAEHVAPPRRG